MVFSWSVLPLSSYCIRAYLVFYVWSNVLSFQLKVSYFFPSGSSKNWIMALYFYTSYLSLLTFVLINALFYLFHSSYYVYNYKAKFKICKFKNNLPFCQKENKDKVNLLYNFLQISFVLYSVSRWVFKNFI